MSLNLCAFSPNVLPFGKDFCCVNTPTSSLDEIASGRCGLMLLAPDSTYYSAAGCCHLPLALKLFFLLLLLLLLLVVIPGSFKIKLCFLSVQNLL